MTLPTIRQSSIVVITNIHQNSTVMLNIIALILLLMGGAANSFAIHITEKDIQGLLLLDKVIWFLAGANTYIVMHNMAQ